MGGTARSFIYRGGFRNSARIFLLAYKQIGAPKVHRVPVTVTDSKPLFMWNYQAGEADMMPRTILTAFGTYDVTAAPRVVSGAAPISPFRQMHIGDVYNSNFPSWY